MLKLSARVIHGPHKARTFVLARNRRGKFVTVGSKSVGDRVEHVSSGAASQALYHHDRGAMSQICWVKIFALNG